MSPTQSRGSVRRGRQRHRARRRPGRTPASFEEFKRVNVGGTRLAVDAARRAGARLVHVSSVAVYGRTEVYAAGADGVTEGLSPAATSRGGLLRAHQRSAEQLVQQEAAHGALSAIAIRPNVIYGERDQLFTRRLVANLKRGLLPQIGPGTNHLFVRVRGNVASAILARWRRRLGQGFGPTTSPDAPPSSRSASSSRLSPQRGTATPFRSVPVDSFGSGSACGRHCCDSCVGTLHRARRRGDLNLSWARIPTRRNALEPSLAGHSVRHANRNQPFGHQKQKPAAPGLNSLLTAARPLRAARRTTSRRGRRRCAFAFVVSAAI